MSKERLVERAIELLEEALGILDEANFDIEGAQLSDTLERLKAKRGKSLPNR